MKLKSTLSLPGIDFTLDQRLSLARFVIATSAEELHDEVDEEVLGKYLHAFEFGPAEYFTQVSDRTTRVRRDRDNIIAFDVALTGVSATPRRADYDFWDGTDRLSEIYTRVATQHLADDLQAQLSARMLLDAPIRDRNRPGEKSPLVEVGPSIIKGSAKDLKATEDEVIMAEMEALIRDRRTLDGFVNLIRRVVKEEITNPGNPEKGK